MKRDYGKGGDRVSAVLSTYGLTGLIGIIKTGCPSLLEAGTGLSKVKLAALKRCMAPLQHRGTMYGTRPDSSAAALRAANTEARCTCVRSPSVTSPPGGSGIPKHRMSQARRAVTLHTTQNALEIIIAAHHHRLLLQHAPSTCAQNGGISPKSNRRAVMFHRMSMLLVTLVRA